MAERALASAYVNIIPGTKDFEGYLKSQLTGKLPQFGANAGTTIGSRMGRSMAGSIRSLVGPAIAALSVRSVVSFGKQLLAAAEQDRQGNARIAQINKSMGLFGAQTDIVTKRLQDYATTQQLSLGIDDEVIKSTEAKLLTFSNLAATAGHAGGMFDRATMAAQDMAAAGFGEATQNAVQLGKALQDPIKGVNALARSGITFSEQQKAQIKTLVESGNMLKAQEIVMKAIETQVGGTAKATATGTNRMREGWSNLRDTMGAYLLPAFDKFAGIMADKVIPQLTSLATKYGPQFQTWFASAGETIVKLVQQLPAFIDGAITKTGNLYQQFKDMLPYIKDTVSALMEIGSSIITSGIGVILDTMVILKPVIKDVAKWIVAHKDAVKDLIITYAVLKVGSTIMGIFNGITGTIFNSIQMLGQFKTAMAGVSGAEAVAGSAGVASKIPGVGLALAAGATTFTLTTEILKATGAYGVLEQFGKDVGAAWRGDKRNALINDSWAALNSVAPKGPVGLDPVGKTTVVQNIYPSEGMSEKQLADKVTRRIEWWNGN